jgi:hypothetical protein
MQATNLAIGMHDCAIIEQLELKMLIGVRLLTRWVLVEMVNRGRQKDKLHVSTEYLPR